MKCDCNPPPAATKGSTVLNVLSSVAIVLFPKCPMCWAAYAGILGIAGIENLPYTPWLVYVLAALFVVTSALLTYRYVRRTAYLSLALYLAGVGLLAFGYFASLTGQWWLWSGATMILLPTLLQNVKRLMPAH